MPAFSFKNNGVPIVIHRFLRASNSRNRFKRNPKDNRLAIGDPSLNPSGTVTDGTKAIAFFNKNIIMFKAGIIDTIKAGPYLKTTGGGEGHHGPGQCALQLRRDGGR